MSNSPFFQRFFRGIENLPCDTKSPRTNRRPRLGIESMEDRTMPTAVPIASPDGGIWVKIDTISVATKTNQTSSSGVTSSVTLDAGKTYLAVAHETARISTDSTGFADAEYIRYNKTTGPQDGSSPGYTWVNHGVRLAGVVGGETSGNLWGAYQSDHQYVKNFIGRGTKVTGYFTDIPGYYGDNSGSIAVDIYANVAIGKTTTTLTTSAPTAVYGQSVTLTANVTASSPAIGLPSGTVTFFDGQTILGVGTLSGGTANLTAKLNAGTHAITAVYGGAQLWSGSSSGITQIITPAPLTVTADDKTKAYGATVPSLTYSVTGFVNGDSASLLTGSLATTTIAASHVGTYSITQGTLSAGSNYTISFAAGTLTVTKVALSVTANNRTKVYGDALPELTYSASGFVNDDGPGDLTGALGTGATSGSDVGSYSITQGSLGSGNYTILFVPGVLVVSRAELNVVAEYHVMVFGDAVPALTYTASGYKNDDTSSILDGALETTAQIKSNVGIYSISQGSLAATNNYTIVFKPSTILVNPASLVITADNHDKARGLIVPALTYTAVGFVTGDSPAKMTGGLETTATSNSPAGTYPITLGTLSVSNYIITFNPGTLTVVSGLVVELDGYDAITGNNVSRDEAEDIGMLAEGDDVSPKAYVIAKDTGDPTAVRKLKWDPSILSISGSSGDSSTPGVLVLPSTGDQNFEVTTLRPFLPDEDVFIDMEVSGTKSDESPLFADVKIKVVQSSLELRQIEFTSDHNLIRKNTTDYLTSGDRYGDVEWKRVRGAGGAKDTIISAPITQTFSDVIKANVTIDTKGWKAGTSFVLQGISSDAGFNLSSSVVISDGNESMTIPVQSSVRIIGAKNAGNGNLISPIFQVLTPTIGWSFSLVGADGKVLKGPDGLVTKYTVGTSSHKAYTTLGIPANQGVAANQITDIRMDRAVSFGAQALKQAVAVGVIDKPKTRRLVFSLLSLHHFNVDFNYTKDGKEYAWTVPDHAVEGSDCISGATFTQLVANVLAIPGAISQQLLIPKGTTATEGIIAIEGSLTKPDGSFLYERTTAAGVRQSAGLFAGGKFNNFEATIVYADPKGTIYLPSGTTKAYNNKNDVLRVFSTFSWASYNIVTEKWELDGAIVDYSKILPEPELADLDS